MWKVIAEGYRFLEAPRFDAGGDLWFSDLHGGGLHRRTRTGRTEHHLADVHRIGGIAAAADGTLIFSAHGGLWHFNPATRGKELLLGKIAGQPIDYVNDIEADADGNILGGTIDFGRIFDTGEPPLPGLLFRWNGTESPEILKNDVRASNGLAFSPDGTSLYHSDSGVGIWRFRQPVDGGPPRDPALHIALEDSDGIACDSIGGIWVARWRHGQLARYHGNGTLDRSIDFPWQVTSLTFGDHDLCGLYISCGNSLAANGTAALLHLRVDVPGLAPHFAR